MMLKLKNTVAGLAMSLAFSAMLLGLTSIVPIFIDTAVYAQEASAKKSKAKRTQALNNKVYEKLTQAQAEVEAKNYVAALKILDGLKNKSKKKLNDFELANVLNLYAFIYYSQEKYQQALAAYEEILVLTKAPEGMLVQARYIIAQLYFATEQWQKGVDALKAWFKVADKPGASAYVLLSQGYYQLKQYELSLKNVNKAVAMYKAKGKVPKENWYGLQRYLYYEKKDYSKTIEVLNELLVHYPKKQYWLQLSGIYGETGRELQQLAAMEAAYIQGLLNKERELVNLAYLYMANEVPYKAAKLLEASIDEQQVEDNAKHLELLANAWRSSQEVKKAIPVMALAAKKSDDGDLWSQLGNIYLDNDEYQKAVNAIRAGLKKGGVKNPGRARLVMGMAHFHLKQYQSARKAFDIAKKDKRSERYAEQWLKYMTKELERERSLSEV